MKVFIQYKMGFPFMVTSGIFFDGFLNFMSKKTRYFGILI